MSHPDVRIAERFVPDGSKSDDPIVINGTPYVVMLGDTKDDCKPLCPERIEDEGLFLTTVYANNPKTGFTVVVEAEVAIDYEQPLYIKDSTVGAVILSNDSAGGTRPLWGKVFEFAKDPNYLTPNGNVWLKRGDTAVTGCVEAVMTTCTCDTSAGSGTSVVGFTELWEVAPLNLNNVWETTALTSVTPDKVAVITVGVAVDGVTVGVRATGSTLIRTITVNTASPVTFIVLADSSNEVELFSTDFINTTFLVQGEYS